MKKTIGGDRLGSGKKMKVELHGYERSTHDKGFVFRSTMSAGTLVPFLKEIALPGDTFDIDLNVDIKTHPTVGPLFGSYKVQLDIFTCPIRLYQGQLHNNKLGIGLKMSTVKLPMIQFEAPSTYLPEQLDNNIGDIDNLQINPSSIFAYLGIRGIGIQGNLAGNPVSRNIGALPWLAYWDIYKNYYSNKQEEIGAVIHNGNPAVAHNIIDVNVDEQGTVTLLPQLTAGAPLSLTTGDLITIQNTGTLQNINDLLVYVVDITNNLRWVPFSTIYNLYSITGAFQNYVYNNSLTEGYILAWAYTDQAATPEINVVTFDLTEIDDMREYILTQTTNPLPVVLSTLSNEPFKLALKQGLAGDYTLNSMVMSQEGLALKTYQSDLLNNWLSTEWIDGTDGIGEITSIDTSGGSFTIDTLNLSKKVYDMLNRIAISGGTYDDWMDAVYTHDRYTRAETPIYHGGLIKELVFQEVVSQSESTNGQPLGTLAGKGTMAQKHKGGQVTIKVDEPSYVLGIVSITPRLDYSQGNDWDIHLQTMDDLHKPALDEIGFQELITEQMAWWDTRYDNIALEWVTRSAGKQPAWINYMTNINKVRGNFAVKDNEMFMVLNRRYQPEVTVVAAEALVTIKDLTTYIDPRHFNHLFADTALDSQNFWTQVGVNMEVRRKISAKLMPNL